MNGTAAVSEAYRADAEARRRAQRDFDRPQVVEAGAGTGKTSILVARILAWCLGPGWERALAELPAGAAPDDVAARAVRGVVAITFTDAAAAEIARRVAEALAELAADRLPVGVDDAALPEPEVRGERIGALLAQLHRLQARTIHSFCQRLLQTFPLEAGLDPGFAVDADGLELELVVSEVVEEEVGRSLRGRPEQRWLDLAACGFGPAEVAVALGQLVEAGVVSARLLEDPFPGTVVAALVTELARSVDGFFAAGGGRLAAARRASRAVATAAEVASLRDRIAELGRPSAEVLPELAAEISGKGLERLAKWGSGDFVAAESAAVDEAGPAVAAACGGMVAAVQRVAVLRPRELAVAREVLAGLLAEVEGRLAARGVVTFHGLLAGAAALLQSQPWLRAQVRREIRQLLVDEFQDTDRLQCEIVRALVLDGPAELRPGLFIVGDPKQTIYGWRDADLAAYAGFVAEVEAAGGALSRLTVNYRSVPAILSEVGRVVAPVMRAEPGLQPDFVDLLPSAANQGDEGFTAGGRGAVEHWLSWPLDPESGALQVSPRFGDANRVEATALAVDLQELRASGVGWGEVAVLLRSTGELDVVLGALRDAGIPFQVARDREYFRRREVVEAAALIRSVVDPLDPLALLAVLRSDVVGVPDAALIPLWRNGFADRMAELSGPEAKGVARVKSALRAAAAEVPAGVPGLERLPGWPLALEAAVETVAVLRGSFRDDPPDLFVERVRTLWLAEATAAARYLGRHRLARLQAFFAALGQVLVERGGSRSEVARFLRRAVERGEESREPTASEVQADAVKVTTIHAAKGLDFEHVYLLQLHRGSGSRDDRTARVIRRAGAVEYSLFGWPTPGFVEAAAWQERVADAEQVRLLYVAATRAKRRLVLAGSWPSGEGRRASRGRPLLDLVSHRAGPGELLGQAQSGVARRLDGDGVHWVLPALALPAPEEIAAPATVPLPRFDRAGLAREGVELARRRAAAAVRMARPIGAAATAEAHRWLEVDEGGRQPDDGGAATPREAAQVVGTTVHHLLETVDLVQELRPQVRRRRQELLERLGRELDPAASGPACARLAALLDRLATGELLSRLQALAGAVLARELPLLLRPAGEEGPLGFLAARVDLLYRDPASGELVIVDYKSDETGDDAELLRRARAYQPQGELYQRGLVEAFGLDHPPRFELWFLDADRVVTR